MRLVIDPLDTHHQSPVDLGDRGEPRAPEAEPEVAAEDLDQALDDRFTLGRQLQVIRTLKHRLVLRSRTPFTHSAGRSLF